MLTLNEVDIFYFLTKKSDGSSTRDFLISQTDFKEDIWKSSI